MIVLFLSLAFFVCLLFCLACHGTPWH
jgi:hypothetical protein